MTDEEKLVELLEKYRKNRRFVALEVLKTQYKAAYFALVDQIRFESVQVAAKPMPPWIENLKLFDDAEEAIREVADIFLRIWEERYKHRVSRAAFRLMDTEQTISLLHELRDEYRKALEEYADQRTCLYAPEECWRKDGTAEKPLLVNPIRRIVWDDERQAWRKPRPGELERPAVMILVQKGVKENG